MTHDPFHDSDLEAYLDEALPAEDMAAIEEALRREAPLREQLTRVCGRRDAGLHSLGAIWRLERLSCPTRDQLGAYLLGALTDEMAGYVRFHVEEVGCRYCQANLTDLAELKQQGAAKSTSRRSKYFQSSAGYLRK